MSGIRSAPLLFVFDLNGCLLSRMAKSHRDAAVAGVANASEVNLQHIGSVGKRKVFLRPHLKTLISKTKTLQHLCHIGIWTSAKRVNAMKMIALLNENTPLQLDVLMTREDCKEVTHDGCDWATIKELQEIYSKYQIYSPERTIIVDDSPFKSHLNSLNAIIIPEWSHASKDAADDDVLKRLSEYIELITRQNPLDVRGWMRRRPFTVVKGVGGRVTVNSCRGFRRPVDVIYPADNIDATQKPKLDCDELENNANVPRVASNKKGSANSILESNTSAIEGDGDADMPKPSSAPADLHKEEEKLCELREAMNSLKL